MTFAARLIILDLILMLNIRFMGMGKHLELSRVDPDRLEGQEQDVGTVGGQGPLQGVNV